VHSTHSLPPLTQATHSPLHFVQMPPTPTHSIPCTLLNDSVCHTACTPSHGIQCTRLFLLTRRCCTVCAAGAPLWWPPYQLQCAATAHAAHALPPHLVSLFPPHLVSLVPPHAAHALPPHLASLFPPLLASLFPPHLAPSSHRRALHCRCAAAVLLMHPKPKPEPEPEP
jgi:hypothetical protein